MTGGKVRADISMSLDGFIAGPNDNKEQGLGEGGERLHEWMYELESWRGPHGLEGGTSNVDAEVLAEAFQGNGAFVMGRRMFDLAVDAWGDNPPFHAPVFVVTHEARPELAREGGTSFIFVDDGIESAVTKAKTAAGSQHVAVAGGADVIRQLLAAGLLDEIQIHIVPVVLGGGVSLFGGLAPDEVSFEKDRVIDSSGVIHLRLKVTS